MKRLLLGCALTVSFVKVSTGNVYASATPGIAVAQPCDVADLACLRRVLLQKQDEVTSLGRQLGLRDEQVKLLENSIQVVTEQRDAALSTNQTLLKAADKLSPKWYDSPYLWLFAGFFVGAGAAIGIAHALPH